MDEALFAHLAARLAGLPPAARAGAVTRGRTGEDVVLATVVATRGATPRKRGSRMLVGAQWTLGTVGGGAMEARVVDAARAVLLGAPPPPGVSLSNPRAGLHALDIDLTGRPGAAGVCGGWMQVTVMPWASTEAGRARDVADALARGERFELDGSGELRPNPRLLIVGGGHCSLALHDLARHLEFDTWVFDPRPDCFGPGRFDGATTRSGDWPALAGACDTPRPLYAVLLNRDYASDVAALRVLRGRSLAFLGMMGSRKRIAEVVAEVGEVPGLVAPVGMALGAETPHEIAVSILAQLVFTRRALEAA